MPQPLYTQTVIAMIWDFDRTLIPGYSQQPLFDAYDVDARVFWAEVKALGKYYEDRGVTVGADTAYLIHMLTYVEHGIFKDLTNTRLRELGGEIPLCPGMPDFMQHTKDFVASTPRYQHHELTVEHYIISTGLTPLVEGSAVGALSDGIWANSFVDRPPPPGFPAQPDAPVGDEGPIAQVGFMIDNTSKTRAVFEINKGPDVHVNSLVAPEDRRVPITNMIYVADGPSDVPVFSIMNQYGGRSLGVYQTGEDPNYEGVYRLQREGRVNGIAEADYREGSAAYLFLMTALTEIADRICADRERRFGAIPPPAGHVVAEPPQQSTET